jgi:hypothetical protein
MGPRDEWMACELHALAAKGPVLALQGNLHALKCVEWGEWQGRSLCGRALGTARGQGTVGAAGVGGGVRGLGRRAAVERGRPPRRGCAQGDDGCGRGAPNEGSGGRWWTGWWCGGAGLLQV